MEAEWKGASHEIVLRTATKMERVEDLHMEEEKIGPEEGRC